MAEESGKYDHASIEKKWQERWAREASYRAEDSAGKPKQYLLIEFPYPSGDGLHVGHIRSWTALDIVARKRRAQGQNVLYPIGWDAFGLPAENYAIKTGVHPSITTRENTDNFRRQIQNLGISFDWSREINTTDPAYYKWTQWIFLQLHKRGLAYKATTLVNWCPKDKIVLANEEVVDGHCERCGTPVEKREKEQWMLAITKYAQRLYDDLDTVDYIPAAKTGQRNWIGPSEGAEIDFALAGSDKKVRIFTTRPDTLFGATYLVLSPEHPLVGESPFSNRDEVDRYIRLAKAKSDVERSAEGREKTGIQLKGVRALNPATKEEIPMFVADYVLGSYGTGAIMAVPAHDERDHEFAQKFNLPVRQVIEPVFVANSHESALREGEEVVKREAVCMVIRNPKDDTYLCNVWKGIEMRGLPTGGIDHGEDLVASAIREAREETGYKNFTLTAPPQWTVNTFFYHRQKKQNRHAHFHFIFLDLVNDERDPVAPEELSKHEFIWKKKEELKNFFTVFEGDFVISLLDDPGFTYTGRGLLANSGQFDGMDSEEAKKKITESVGGEWTTTYRLRDWVFSRQRYWGEPIPMIYCDKDGWVPVPEAELPVVLPQVDNYQPTDTGESPLAGIAEWVNTVCPRCGGPAKRETDVMPNWAGSSWYYLRYADPHNAEAFAGQDKLKYWTPVDWYNGGMEHTTLHLLYSRFWHKFLFDIGAVPTSEPYMKRTSHGLILTEGGEKMSKSKGNTVSPDALVAEFGADALRLYEMFIGPFDQPVAWSTAAISGTRRFLDRVWKLEPKGSASQSFEALLNQTIKKVGEDIEALKLNTAVSALMILLNEMEKGADAESYAAFIRLLAPFAPHIAHELAERHGIDLAMWPQYDGSKLASATVRVAVQVGGKTRGTITLSPEATQEEALAVAHADPALVRWIEGELAKVVYVPGKILSIVVK